MITNAQGRVKLHNDYRNGHEMPGLAYGTIGTTKEALKAAVKAGYRNFDTAEAYGNEELVGQGLREAMDEYGIPREEIFVSTKLWHTHRSHDMALEAFAASKERLGLDYIDLYLIHWPANATWHDNWREINHDAWSGLEDLYNASEAKAIGVSNYLAHHLEALIADSDIAPMVNQIEYHPGFAQTESAEFCQRNGIIVEAWSPFGRGDVLQQEPLMQIANKYGKSPAQVILRWLVQKDIVPVAKSSNANRIKANLDLFDFSLSADDIAVIEALPPCGGMQFDPDTAQS